MQKIRSLKHPERLPTPDAIKSWKQNEHHYEPDFWEFQLSYVKAMMTELALVGQADYIESDELMELFALFVNSCLSCPMEKLLNTGSIHLQVISLLRMFGNGAFKEILKSLPIVWELEAKNK